MRRGDNLKRRRIRDTFSDALTGVTINGICFESIYRPDIHVMVVYQ